MTTNWMYRIAVVAAPLLLVTTSFVPASSRSAKPLAMIAAANDIAGVVTGPKGPEAGVWVIAETTELPTKLVKIAGAMSSPSSRRRRTASGCAATGWSIRPSAAAPPAPR